MKPESLRLLNSRLLRNYLTNYEHPLALTYIEGDYRIQGARLLDGDDFIRQGFVVRARAMVAPDEFHNPSPYPVLIDYVFPTDRTGAMAGFDAGDLLEVTKSPNCAAIIHVDHVMEDGEKMVCLTVVPIAYGSYRVGKGDSFEIEPPTEVSPGAVFPMFGE